MTQVSELLNFSTSQRAIDIYHELITYGIGVDIYDPWANPSEVKEEYRIDMIKEIKKNSIINNYEAVILAVAHDDFENIDFEQL